MTMKITWHAVHCIRHWYAHGTSITTLAREFGLSERHVYDIINNVHWHDDNYVPTPPQPPALIPQKKRAIERECRVARRKMKEAVAAGYFEFAEQWVRRIQLLELQSDCPIAELEKV